MLGAMRGRHSTGTPKAAHGSGSHSQVERLMSEVRDAVVTSVLKRSPRRSRKKASVVPSRSRPRRASARAPGTSRRIQASLEAEK